MNVLDAISAATKLLSSTPAQVGPDPRWQAIIAIGEFIDSEPEAVWKFIVEAASGDNDDLQAALATCLLEHLIDAHLDYKQRAIDLAASDKRIAKLLSMCW